MAAGTLVSSGSSLNMPTGSGSERLRRATIHALNNDTQTILTGVAGHIYTILTVSFNDQSGTAGQIEITMNDGSNDIRLLRSFSVPGSGQFVWNDKFILEENDYLKVQNQSTSGDWMISYIDQDWS
jgi:hypothetical protein